MLRTQMASLLADVVVIGGSDGPTAIYTATKLSPWVWVAGGIVLALLVAAVAAAVFLRRNKND